MKEVLYENLIRKAITENKNRNPNTILFQLKFYLENICNSSIISKSQNEVGVVCDSLLILDSFFAKGLSFSKIKISINTTLSINYVKSLAFLCLSGKKKIPNGILVIGHSSVDPDLFSIDTKLYSKQIQSTDVKVIKPKFISYIMRNKNCLGLSQNKVESLYKIMDSYLFVRGNKAVLICEKSSISVVVKSSEFKRHFDYIKQCMIIGINKEADMTYD